jgi:hypothetical protein
LGGDGLDSQFFGSGTLSLDEVKPTGQRGQIRNGIGIPKMIFGGLLLSQRLLPSVIPLVVSAGPVSGFLVER